MGDIPALRLFMLGKFELSVGGRIAIGRDWHRAKAKQVLKLLALQVGRRMHRDQVLDALWPDVEPEAAANNLHKNLHYIRTAIGRLDCGEDVISLRDGMVVLSDAQARSARAAGRYVGALPGRTVA
jgi:DNA-binding SARP family transcriptional activator